MNEIFYHLPIICLIAGLLIEVFLYITKTSYQSKKTILVFCIIFSTFGASALVVNKINILSLAIVFLTVYRVFNLLKIAENKINPEYLHNASFRTYRWLAMLQIITIFLWFATDTKIIIFNNDLIIAFLAVLFTASSLVVAVSTLTKVKRSRFKTKISNDKQSLPTLTLAIAARNENLMLDNCLASAIANNYPKLEIIVYDDCSQDRTAEIIKAYAQKGVRFIQGGPVPEKWLAKNWAYQKLLEQSSGDLIMYMGVDVQLQPDTLNNIVEAYIKNKATMMSVLPKRIKSGMLAAFVQPMRYWWEFAIPSYIMKRPPVLSTCWIIQQEVLNKIGGFKSMTRAIIPEEHLAKGQSKINKYAFIRSNSSLGLSTIKNFYSQWSTAVRTRYPQVHRRPELVAIRTMAMLLFLLLPFIFLFIPLDSYSSYPFILICSVVSVILLSLSNILISLISNPVATLMSIINFPVVVALDIFALNYSMYKYEFSKVTWRGRNVSNIAMHVIKNLPKV